MLASRAIIGMFEVLAMITVRSSSERAGARILELGQLVEDVGHLVAALAAADVDDHVGVAPLGDLLQQDGLAGAEAAGHGGAAAAGDREEQVEHALAGDQRHVGAQPLAYGRGRRTGHSCAKLTATPDTSAIGSPTVYSPAGAIHSSVPRRRAARAPAR